MLIEMPAAEAPVNIRYVLRVLSNSALITRINSVRPSSKKSAPENKNSVGTKLTLNVLLIDSLIDGSMSSCITINSRTNAPSSDQKIGGISFLTVFPLLASTITG